MNDLIGQNLKRESRVHHLTLPITREQARDIAVGDMVYLNGEIVVTIGLPTHQRIIDNAAAGEPLPAALPHGAFFHLSCFNREREDGSFEALYMNPSTSTRYNSFMPRIIRALDLRMVGGKGGLDAESVAAMRQTGTIYLSFLGGGCTLLARAIEEVAAVDWTDYISQFRLVTLRVKDLGPATVGIDAHGNSVYTTLARDAQDKLPALLAQMKAERNAPAAPANE
jgi:fumarate hydratase subunit beta